MAEKEEKFEMEGTVTEALPATQFRIKLENGHELLAYLSGRCAAITFAFCWATA